MKFTSISGNITKTSTEDKKSARQSEKIIISDNSDNKNKKLKNAEKEVEVQAFEDDIKKELLIMTIEIGNDQEDTIYVNEDDDPYNVAEKFVNKHNLNQNIISPLSHNIYTNMEQVLKEKLEILDDKNLKPTLEETAREENKAKMKMINFSNTISPRQQTVTTKEDFAKQELHINHNQFNPEDKVSKNTNTYYEDQENNLNNDTHFNNYQQANEIKEEPFYDIRYTAGNIDHSQHDKLMKANVNLSSSDYVDCGKSAYTGPPFLLFSIRNL